MDQGSRFSPRDIPLEKRATNIEGRFCATQCAYQNYSRADPNDCRSVYQGIYSTTGVFTLPGSKSSVIELTVYLLYTWWAVVFTGADALLPSCRTSYDG